MIERLARRLLCRLGQHDVIRCAGAEDHAWRHNGRRWVATLDRVPPTTPVARDSRGVALPAAPPAPARRRHRSTP